MSASTQAIKLDHNRLSCPTPSKHIRAYKGKKLFRLTHAIEEFIYIMEKEKCQLRKTIKFLS
jgi:hypothetical protein